MKISRWFWVVLGLMLLASATLLTVGLRRVGQSVDQRRLQAAQERVQHVQTLVTTRYRYRDVVFFDRRTHVLGIPAGQQEVLFSIQMEVAAGVDLSQGFDLTLDRDDRRSVFVTLPAPEVLRVVTDEESIQQYVILERFGRLNWLDVSTEIQAAKERNRDDAIERGILGRAEMHTRTVIGNLLRTVGYESVEIRFRPVTDGVRG
ncbi:MAG: DUF4230 domain-containing protein [Alkalispirochaeta sp.]